MPKYVFTYQYEGDYFTEKSLVQIAQGLKETHNLTGISHQKVEGGHYLCRTQLHWTTRLFASGRNVTVEWFRLNPERLP